MIRLLIWRYNDMERKLRQCPYCKEWFNTTLACMIDHYKEKHESAVNKAFAIAELVTKQAWHDAKSKFTPFPECMQHYVSARVIENQISRVISSTPPDKTNHREKFFVGAQTALGTSKQTD